MDKVAYNHCDSYPSGLGNDIAKFICGNSDAVIARLARKVAVVDSGSKPTEEQKAICRAAGTVNLGVSTGKEDEWYCLLREAQGSLGILKKVPFMIDSADFLVNSISCEYGYVINVDTGMLEVYLGFNEDDGGKPFHPFGRYAVVRGKNHDGTPGDYWGVSLVAEISLAKVRRMGASKAVSLMDRQTRLSLGADDEGNEDKDRARQFRPLVLGGQAPLKAVTAKSRKAAARRRVVRKAVAAVVKDAESA